MEMEKAETLARITRHGFKYRKLHCAGTNL